MSLHPRPHFVHSLFFSCFRNAAKLKKSLFDLFSWVAASCQANRKLPLLSTLDQSCCNKQTKTFTYLLFSFLESIFQFQHWQFKWFAFTSIRLKIALVTNITETFFKCNLFYFTPWLFSIILHLFPLHLFPFFHFLVHLFFRFIWESTDPKRRIAQSFTAMFSDRTFFYTRKWTLFSNIKNRYPMGTCVYSVLENRRF